ncbi:DNA mismatch repair protein MutL [Polyergus mexicanus]|uniref:DNA mismatch repair protein MutL n=1 Tax=Polyergus mexicanus TaxID=615972 RepID=UPI0038B585CE
MRHITGLNAETLTGSNVASFIQCILELTTNSVIAHATAIAIRIHAGKRKVQVIDNGVGMSKDLLQRVAEYNDAKTIDDQQRIYELIESNDRTLTNIRRLSDGLTIASRHRYSMDTFVKIFKIGSAPNLAQIEQRPSHGTTVSVYNFHEVSLNEKWDMSTVCFFIAAVAVTKLKVSFSIRDEERKKIVLRIAKPHSPIQVLKTFFGKSLSLNHLWLIQCRSVSNMNGYIGLWDKNVTQWIFLNHRLIYCPFILKLIKIAFENRNDLSSNRESNAQDLHDKNLFILLFFTLSPREFTFFNENGKRHVIFYDMQKILSNIHNCIFKCLTEETIICAAAALFDLCETQSLKHIYLKAEGSIFNNNINGYNKNVISLKERKVVTIGPKRKRITPTIVTNERYNTESNNMKIINCAEEENSVLNNEIDIASTKHTNLCKNKITKKMHNDIDRMPAIFANLAATNDFVESHKICNYHDGNDLENMISPLSEWSNWSYYTNNRECNSAKDVSDKLSKKDIRFQRLVNYTDQFDFLPRKLHGLLRYRHVKLTNMKCINSPNNTISPAENWQHKQIAVHRCNLKRKLCEFKLSRVSLKRIKIINQVNDEFIAAWIMYDEMKILLMIDQHAVHERIRYENLLLRYKGQNEGELLSVNLRNPLTIQISTKTRDSLLRRKILLKKYGINLGSLKANTKLLIRTIPQCLVTNNNDRCNGEKVLSKIYDLLDDILKNCSTTSRANTLPLTIHNAIASEACHGAIKFGDKLTLEQCTYLMKLLKCTKFPNRCAHGRPTIIPVMELSELEKRSARISEKKLNFASLKRSQ